MTYQDPKSLQPSPVDSVVDVEDRKKNFKAVGLFLAIVALSCAAAAYISTSKL